MVLQPNGHVHTCFASSVAAVEGDDHDDHAAYAVVVHEGVMAGGVMGGIHSEAEAGAAVHVHMVGVRVRSDLDSEGKGRLRGIPSPLASIVRLFSFLLDFRSWLCTCTSFIYKSI